MPLRAAVLRAAGDMAGQAAMILGSADGADRWQQGGERWTLQAPVASLAASPEFQRTGVAIAGGFRSGIRRTEDAGQTWRLVVAQPSAIVAGNDEIGVMTFLSPTCVVAANGGQKVWCEF